MQTAEKIMNCHCFVTMGGGEAKDSLRHINNQLSENTLMDELSGVASTKDKGSTFFVESSVNASRGQLKIQVKEVFFDGSMGEFPFKLAIRVQGSLKSIPME
jgi:hypothetical protein